MIKVLERFFPKKTVEVTTVRNVAKRGYDAGRVDRLTTDWMLSTGTSADYDIYQALTLVRARARDLANNNDIIRKYLRLVVNNVVGPDGFLLQVKAQEPTGEYDTYANRLIERKFTEWSRKQFCTVTGMLSFRHALALIMQTVARDGEMFIRTVKNKDLNKFGFSLQLIEPDFIDERYNTALPNGNVICMGVEIDQVRRPIAYYVKKTRPGNDVFTSAIYGGDYERVPADEMIHLYDPERANQTRGISWMVSSMFRIKMISEFEKASLVNARASANQMGFFTTNTGTEGYQGDDEDTDGNMMMDAEPGTFQELPKGMDFKAYDPKYPNELHEPFVKSMLRIAASGLGVSYHSLANDLEGVNYSSIRAGLLDERDNWKTLQSWLIENFLNEVFEKWLDMALLTGELQLPYSKFDKFNNPSWLGRRWQWVDPEKDVTANILAVQNGFKTNTQVCAEIGNDINDVYLQLNTEAKLQKKYNLTLGVKKDGQNSGNTKSSASAEADGGNAGNA